MPCITGMHHGSWSANFTWDLSAGCPPLLSFVSVAPECLVAQPWKTKLWRRRSCIRHDDDLVRRHLANLTLLAVGDSTSARTFHWLCQWFGASAPSSWLQDAEHDAPGSRARGYRAGFSGANHLCRIPGGPVVGHFLHYGAVGPPYFNANPGTIVPYLANTTQGQVAENLPSFCQQAGCASVDGSPTLVVASSLLWDASAWAQHGSSAATHDATARKWDVPYNFSDAQAREYTGAVHRMVHALRRRFPRAGVAWRTLHPSFKRGRGVSPASVEQLNQAVRAHAAQWGLPILDAGRMMAVRPYAEQPYIPLLNPRSNSSALAPGTEDGSHLMPWLEVPVVNLVLNQLARMSELLSP